MTLKTTEKQAGRVHALIRDSCANCQDGRCLLLGDSCIQLLSLYGIYCKYFLTAVLPGNPQLYEEILNHNN